MANVRLENFDVTDIVEAVPLIAGLAPTPSLSQGDPATTAVYYNPNVMYGPLVYLGGTGFTYDASTGRLLGGTVTSISFSHPPVSNGVGLNAGSTVAITGTSITVPTLLSRDALNVDFLLGILLAGNNTYTTVTATVTGSAGDDVFNILGATTKYIYYPGIPANAGTHTTVKGGAGQNTGVFNGLRTDATLAGGGGNENMLLMDALHLPSLALTAELVSIDKLQFLDGATYETNGSFGAQAALMFEGVFGRLPDAINAGGFALVAEQSGRETAAALMLATPEGGGNTAGLSNAQFVTRLYNDMLHRAPEAQGLAGWQADLDSGQLGRADVTARFAGSIEAQTANASSFASGAVFAADTNAVEVLRAYETLLGRTPEAVSLSTNISRLRNGMTLQQFYTQAQRSAEFAARGPNPYGITAATSYATVFAIAHSDPVNSLVGPLVTSVGVAHQ